MFFYGVRGFLKPTSACSESESSEWIATGSVWTCNGWLTSDEIGAPGENCTRASECCPSCQELQAMGVAH
eukprot:3054899-Rhodomonas_salina.1